MEMFVLWVTSVLRVVGHPDPVLLAASSQSLELPLPPTATLALLGNIASVVVAHSPQVWYFGFLLVKFRLRERLECNRIQKYEINTEVHSTLVCFLPTFSKD